jgi:acetoin utilization deacetylase AcuC-like enzyme
MILYDRSLAMRFPEYGILIPVLDSRADTIVRAVREKAAGPDSAWLRTGVSERVTRADVERAHDAAFAARLFGGERLLEAELLKTYELIDANGRPHRYEPEKAVRPLTSLFDTILRQVAGTYEACTIALDSGFCFFLGGGMHHARRDGGSGFCPLNDSMIAVARLRAEGRARFIWIIDVDAHKGDGTAELALNDPQTLTLDVHMAEGWPLDPETLETARREGRGADRAPFARSDVEIPVRVGEDARYVSMLAEGLHRLETLSGNRKPDLAIVVDGADPYCGDGLPSSAGLALSLEQCLERDRAVRDFLGARNIPSAWVMAGGYGDRSWEPPAAFLTDTIMNGRLKAKP